MIRASVFSKKLRIDGKDYDSAIRELRKAQALIRKIKMLSRYNVNHDKILYAFQEIHTICDQYLNEKP